MPAPLAVDPRPIRSGESHAAVLLLHGLTGTPHEVRPLADALRQAGYAVRAPVLAGHSDLEALERSTWRDWYGSAHNAFNDLLDGGARNVAVLGFSMGALLALRMAAMRPRDVRGLVALAVPLRFRWWQRQSIVALAKLRSSRVLGAAVGLRKAPRGQDIRIMREVDDSPNLDAQPYPALAELIALQREVGELLPHVRAPTLLLHGRYDHTSPVADSEAVSQALGSARVERRVLPRSFHGVGLDLDRELACASVREFVASLELHEASPQAANAKS